MTIQQSISNTAYYCCGARYDDAKSDDPVCDDQFAKFFMDKKGLDIYKQFDLNKLRNGKIANATRHRIIDDILSDTLMQNQETVIILIGAGYDSRAFRISGGTWVEIDDPNLIDLKNKLLPVTQCKNAIKRIPYDYRSESLKEKLPKIADSQKVVVVVEGVFFYMEDSAIMQFLEALKQAYPDHKLICDLQRLNFFKKYNQPLSEIMISLGSPFKVRSNKPEKTFIERSYSLSKRISILERVIEFGKIKIPMIVFNLLLRRYKYGYSVFIFDHRGS